MKYRFDKRQKYSKVRLTIQQGSANVIAFREWKSELPEDKQRILDAWIERLALTAGKNFGTVSATELLAQVMLFVHNNKRL